MTAKYRLRRTQSFTRSGGCVIGQYLTGLVETKKENIPMRSLKISIPSPFSMPYAQSTAVR